MNGSDALAEIARRLQADLRTRFPRISVHFTDEDGSPICHVGEGGVPWGSVGTWVDPADELSLPEFEDVLVAIAQDVADNLWPDELVDPWPPCPQNSEHPLQPSLVRGSASWACSSDAGVAIPIGTLSER